MKKFKIHFTFILTFFLLIFSKIQFYYLVFLLCLFIHEFGHLLAIRIYKKNINKLTLYSFGFLIDMSFNNDFESDLVIYSSGILCNLLVFLLTNGIIKEVSLIMFIINVLPLYPLDGYNIIECALAYFLPYKIAIISSLVINLLFLIYIGLRFINYIDIFICINFLFFLKEAIVRLLNVNKIYTSLIIYKRIYPNNLSYKNIKFDENLLYKFHKYKKIKTKILNKEIFEEQLLKLNIK